MTDPKEMAKILRKCADGECDDTCPYATVEHDCSAVMLQDAANILDPQDN